VEDSDIEDLRAADCEKQGIYEVTAPISFFNYSGRLEASSGLPMAPMPEEAPLPKPTPDKPAATESKGTLEHTLKGRWLLPRPFLTPHASKKPFLLTA
jgi:hypothetical protein